MDQNAENFMENQARQNRRETEAESDGRLYRPEEELPDLLDSLMKKGASVNAGGSMTLAETGIITDYLYAADYSFYDKTRRRSRPPNRSRPYTTRHFPRITISPRLTRLPRTAIYSMSTDAATASPRRCTAPENVFVVVGRNKCVKTVEDAIQRNREISGPANCIRLGKKTPCSVTGQCADCSSPDRICNEFTLSDQEKQSEGENQGDPSELRGGVLI